MTKQGVQKVERIALRKVRARLVERGVCVEDVRALDGGRDASSPYAVCLPDDAKVRFGY